MKLTFVGATRTVTGSCYHLRAGGVELLVDCGLYQGGRAIEARNRLPFPFDPGALAGVVLTHAHIDHSGLVPRLVREGFAGPIWCHRATADLAAVMLKDSAYIQEMQVRSENRKRDRRGLAAIPPLYSREDAEAAERLLSPVDYGRSFDLDGGRVSVEFLDAGHILGSSILRFTVVEDDGPVTILFSGDLGNTPAPILNDPAQFDAADVVLLESTYGDRVHEDRLEREERLGGIVRDVFHQEGTILVPAFAVGRTQELLYALHNLLKDGKIPKVPVYIDSPLATEATEVFRRHPECYDPEMRALIADGDDPLEFAGLKLVRDASESMELNTIPGPKLIISASGMCTAGRILHHLKHNLWKPSTTVVFVGYQGVGTLGRALVTGAKTVHIFGEPVRVNCRIEQIGGFSAHADQNGLLAWLGRLSRPPRRVFLIHGEENAALALAAKVDARFGAIARVPQPGETAEITARRETIHPAAVAPAEPRTAVTRDWSRELESFMDEMLVRAKTFARDARALRAQAAAADAESARGFDKSLSGSLASFRQKLDRVLADVAGPSS
jgi:metallo-beta-lactamase family protein